MSTPIAGNSASTATIAINSSLQGSLDFNGDTDWYRVELVAGYGYQIWLEGYSSGLGTLVDPCVAVFNSAGTTPPLAFGNDIALLNWDAYATFVPSSSSTYFISAEEFGNNATGTYRLTVWQDQLSTVATAATIAPNTAVTDRIGWGVDTSDWYAITLSAGVNYQFDLVGSARDGANFALLDPFLFLRNSNGTVLVGDDDSGVGTASRIFFTPATSGTYFLDVQESGLDAAGVYSLIVNQTPVAGSLQLDVPKPDSIDFTGDTDLFSLSLTAGVSYGFEVVGGTLADPLLELLGSNGDVIATDDDSGPGLNSRLTFTPTVSGNYFLAARAANNSSLGTFTARAWELPSISISDATIQEGNTSTKSLGFAITLSKPSPVDVSFKIGTRAGTASTASGDYQGILETEITMPAGSTSTVFSVPVVGDRQFEPTEVFSVLLTDPSMASVADGFARGIIIDDDAPYALPSDPLSRLQWHL
ncbi:MAG: hypothetical protein EBV34_19840, partial [Betaproteobacteria bacterium]|nr:hypothetical protein [Betaproteobacteria bacterium]